MADGTTEHEFHRLYTNRHHCYCDVKLEEVGHSGSFVKECPECGYVLNKFSFEAVSTQQELYSGSATDGAFQGTKGSRFTLGITDLRSVLAKQRVRRSISKAPEFKSKSKRAQTRILDFGCGQGYLLDALNASGIAALGVEVCAESARFARKKGRDVRLDLGEIQDKSCDGVIAIHVLEHLPDVDAKLVEIKKVLKPGAYFQFEVPNFDCLQTRMFKYNCFHAELELHAHHFSPVSFERLLAKHGFKVEKIRLGSLEQGIMGWTQSYLNTVFPYNRFYRRFILNRPWSERVEALPDLVLFPPLVVLAVFSYTIERLMGLGPVVCVEGHLAE